MMPFTHAARLERWLGPEVVANCSASMREWYGPPIPLVGVPGAVFVTKGGEFVGPIEGGGFGNMADFLEQRTRRIMRNTRAKQRFKLNAGFSSLSDLISEATTGGKSQLIPFSKAGVAGVVARHNSLWNTTGYPITGAAGGSTGTGAARTRTTAGALGQIDATGGDQLHITTMVLQASVTGQMMLLYDRLWDMTHTMTVDPRSVDAANPPTRYQTTALAPGNFLSGEVTTVLPAASPTITCDYVDHEGNNATGAAFTIQTGAAVQTVPFVAGAPWFYPLLAGDFGLRSFQNSANAINLSAAMASGVVTWFIGHPLAMIPIPAANTPVILDGINSAFNLQRVYDSACVTFLELAKSATTATNWWGTIQMVSG